VKTKIFHAVVDSGSALCLFHANFLKPFGIRLEDGIEHSIGGIGKQIRIPIFYHDVRLLFGVDRVFGMRAGFSEELAVAGILGRHGFFDSFRITFDHSEHPPSVEVEKLEPKTVH